MVVLAGAGVEHLDRSHPMNVIDLAPTLAHLLGTPIPKDAEGNVLKEVVRSQG